MCPKCCLAPAPIEELSIRPICPVVQTATTYGLFAPHSVLRQTFFSTDKRSAQLLPSYSVSTPV